MSFTCCWVSERDSRQATPIPGSATHRHLTMQLWPHKSQMEVLEPASLFQCGAAHSLCGYDRKSFLNLPLTHLRAPYLSPLPGFLLSCCFTNSPPPIPP